MRHYDPSGERYGLPTYPLGLGLAPEGLATRRQLREAGLRPGGQDPVAQLAWTSRRYAAGPRTRVAYLYRIDRALPVRPMTPGRQRALAAAMRARRTCPTCTTVQPYCIPRSLGECLTCADRAAETREAA